MRARAALPLVAGIAVVVLALQAGLVPGVEPPLPLGGTTGPPGGFEGVLRFRPGDRLTYQAATEGGEATVEVRVLEPRMVVAANQTPVLGLPLVMEMMGGGERLVDAYVVDAVHGGLVLSVEGCVVEPAVPCRDARATYVTWQECPFNGAFSPADMVPRSALAGPTVRFADPLKPSTVWTFDARPEGRDLVRLTLRDVTAERRLCGGGEGFLLDLRQGLVREASLGDVSLRLDGVSRGAGPEVVLGGGPPQASALLPLVPRPAHAPGMETLGPAEFRFAEAWAKARESAPLREYLARRPDAFVYKATNTTAEATAVEGTVRQTVHEWRIQVLGLDRSMVVATVVKEVTRGLPPRYDVDVSPAAVPEDVPARFGPPAARAASLVEFRQKAAEAGYEPSRLFDPDVSVLFDGEDADYRYTLFLRGTATRLGGVQAASSSEALVLNADTGRVTDVTVPLEAARRMAGVS